MVDKLALFGHRAEGRRYVINSSSGPTFRRLENFLCRPRNKWISVSNQAKGAERHRLSYAAATTIEWASNLRCPYGHPLMANLYILNLLKDFLEKICYDAIAFEATCS